MSDRTYREGFWYKNILLIDTDQLKENSAYWRANVENILEGYAVVEYKNQLR